MSVFVRRIEIDNVKLLKRVRLSFERNGDARPWTVLVGENGTGKTTILQAVAMAASGATRSMQLADVASLPDRRQSSRARIRALLEVGGPLDGTEGTVARPSYRLVDGSLVLESGSQRIVGTSAWVGDTQKPLADEPKKDVIDDAQTATGSSWFVVAYGVRRELNGRASFERRSQLVADRLGPLFDPDAPILGPAFAEQMLEREMASAYGRTLTKVLVNGGLLPGITAIDLLGPGSVRAATALHEGNSVTQQAGSSKVQIPARWLSQGYQATVSWVADLVGQALLQAGRPMESEEIEGLVLVDELDLFLHPAWQQQLVPALRATFPRVQFVATTHSPLVLTGLRRGEAHLVAMDEAGDATVRPIEESPQLRTGSELYADFFGVDGLAPTRAAAWLRRYGLLANNPFRTDEEDHEMSSLRQQLASEGVEVGFEPRRRVGENGTYA